LRSGGQFQVGGSNPWRPKTRARRELGRLEREITATDGQIDARAVLKKRSRRKRGVREGRLQRHHG
jgi:hypothetical protein